MNKGEKGEGDRGTALEASSSFPYCPLPFFTFHNMTRDYYGHSISSRVRIPGPAYRSAAGAAPYHDWNEEIMRVYGTNAHAQVWRGGD